MNKKAQGLSITTIVVAAIAVVVLVVLVLIFTGKMGWFRGSSGSCEVNGGSCVAAEDCSGKIVSGYTCSDKDKVCCFSLESNKTPQSS